MYNVYEPPIGLAVAINSEVHFEFVSLDVHSIQIGHIPQGSAASQTGDVTAATRLRIGQRRLITAPQTENEDSAQTRKHRCPSRYKNRGPPRGRD